MTKKCLIIIIAVIAVVVDASISMVVIFFTQQAAEEKEPSEVEITVNWAKYGNYTPQGFTERGYFINISFTNKAIPYSYYPNTLDFSLVWPNGISVEAAHRYWPCAVPPNTTVNFTIHFDMPLQETNPQKIVFHTTWGLYTPTETYAEATIPTITIEDVDGGK